MSLPRAIVTADIEGPRPSVAVVMAAYNAGSFIDESLASLDAQTWRPDEVIVVDDASADDTADRVRAWSARLPLTLIELDRNGGAGAARALAMRSVQSELATFLDADDVLLPNHIEHLVAVRRHHGGIVSPRAMVWRPGEPGADYHRALGLVIPRRHHLAHLITDNYLFYAALFARTDYERVGGLRNVRLFEDWDLWVRMVASGTAITVASIPTVLYRRHPQNLTVDAASVDDGLAHLIDEFRHEHAEWLHPSEWDRVVRRRRALGRAHRGMARLRRGDLAGAAELARAVASSRTTLARLTRQGGYRVARAATRRRVPAFR
jgi:glycosyltransferase involved in cell wall biosynthesis